MRPLLSIVIANYNYGRFLEDALRSIMLQGMGNRVEIIICDAASTDNSVEIIKKYVGNLPPNVERDSTLHLSPTPTPVSWWCSEKDGGQSAAFNKGFSHARGEWLTWLNADELYCDGALLAFAKKAEKYRDARWIAANDCLFDDATKKITYVGWGPHLSWPFFVGRRGIAAVFGPSSFFKKELFFEIGGFDESLHYSMDSDLWIKFIMLDIRQYRLNKICWKCRVQEHSKTFGAQTNESLARKKCERDRIMSNTGYVYQTSCSNVWYLLWMLSRIVDLSLCVRMWKRVSLVGKLISVIK